MRFPRLVVVAVAGVLVRDRGGERAAVDTLIKTAKPDGVDPQNWLADVLAPLPDDPARRTDDLMPWRSKASPQVIAA